MHRAILSALVLSAAAAGGTVMNEGTHAGVSEALGLGHHHLADYGGYHCAAHDGSLGPQHQQHMHNETHLPHGGCPGGPAMHSRSAPGGMMDG